VVALHPDAEGKPCLIGNCQAGWQIMMMSAIHPEKVGPVMLAGSPLSYWAGVHGKNPMRYLGGLLGGTWLTSLVGGDLGNGIFDGANLVANFESLRPDNTYWKKIYNVYSKIDTEPPRFLEFEKWWGSPVLMNAGEMQSIADQLFVGNKLTSGELRAPMDCASTCATSNRRSLCSARGATTLRRRSRHCTGFSTSTITKTRSSQPAKEIVKEQYLILLLDAERAIAALPKLLPGNRRQCEEALVLVRRALAARGALPEEGGRRLERVEALFLGPPPEIRRDKAA
jgi:hypothetical protein